MNKTKIEYCNYTWNPVTGCLHACDYCYARRIALRFWGNFAPKFHLERIYEPLKLREPSIIFAVDMGDLFGEWVPSKWIYDVLHVAEKACWHKFIFLTKNPKRLTEFVYPANVWLGVTVDRQKRVEGIKSLLATNAKVKFVSFEPLLENVNLDLNGLNWIIIGAQTNPERQPEKEWVDKLVTQARQNDIKVFMKNNLNFAPKFQELPESLNKQENRGGVQTRLFF